VQADKELYDDKLTELGCTWADDKDEYKVSPLWCLCRRGKLLQIRAIFKQKKINVNGGVHDTLLGRTLVHAASISGEFELVAFLLLNGATIEKDKAGRIPKDYTCQGNPFQITKLKKLWISYNKGGAERLAMDFPHLLSESNKLTQSVNEKTSRDEINSYIKQHQETLPNLQGKIFKDIDKKGDNMMTALEDMLAYYRYQIQDAEGKPTTLNDKYQKYLKQLEPEEKDNNMGGGITETTKERSKPTVIQATVDIWSVNITIIFYSTSQKKVSLKRYFVNKYTKSNYPTLYMTFDGKRYDYLVDPQMEKPSPLNLFKLIELPVNQSPLDVFASALNMFDSSILNQTYEHKPNDREWNMNMSLLYYAARLGRSDCIQLMLSIVDGLDVNLGETRDKNSPLHVASWRGHYNVVVMLLYVKADTQLQNARGDLPSLIDPALPDKLKTETIAIWTAYDKGYDYFLQQYSNFIIVEKDLATLTASTDKYATNSAYSQLLVSTTVTVEQLCATVDSENSPPISDFKIILSKFNKKDINTLSATHRCTILYAACRKGNFDIVKELLTIPNISLKGPQETYSLHGNTCLHVANWRGHVRIVAYLISKGAILEPKQAGNKVPPNNAQERNYTLEESVRSTLATVYRNSSPPNEKLLNEIINSVDVGKTISAVDPLPLWAVIGLPKDEIPPQYMSMF